MRWTPGTPHDSAPNVVAAEQEGKWRAAAGFRWVSQERGDFRVEPTGDHHARNGNGSGAFDRERLQRIKDLATLGLDEGADWRDVESAFRRLVKMHHPDRVVGAAKDAVESAHRAFLLLRQAYDRLKGAWREGQ